MKLFDPGLMQVVTENPENPWLLPGAAVLVIVLARYFFMRKNIRRPLDTLPVKEEPADPKTPEVKTPPGKPAPAPVSIPGTSLRYLPFSQPPMAPYAVASCYDKDLDPALRQELAGLNPQVFALVAADESWVIVQSRDGVRRVEKQAVLEIQLHPVLPAKGGGMVLLLFQVNEGGETIYREFIAYPAYSPELQRWCHERAEALAQFLNLPLTVSREGYDC